MEPLKGLQASFKQNIHLVEDVSPKIIWLINEVSEN